MDEKRITAKVDAELHRQVKIEAARRGLSLSDIVRDALRAFVGRKPESKTKTSDTTK